MTGGASRRWRERGLLPRVATIAVGAPVLLAVLWAGGAWLLVVVLGLVALGSMEFLRLARGAGHQSSWVLVAGALIFPALAGAGGWEAAGTVAVAVVIGAAAASLRASKRAAAPAAAAIDTLGAFYVGALFAHTVVLRAEAGPVVTLVMFVVIWSSDIVAYLVGVRLGRHKLAPAISPGKSVEGLLAGLSAAVLVATVVASSQGWPTARWGIVGLCIALAGVVGDLFKSTMKRAAGVKDSGTILPGHGGVLDRFDAVLFGVPVGYYLWRWLL